MGAANEAHLRLRCIRDLGDTGGDEPMDIGAIDGKSKNCEKGNRSKGLATDGSCMRCGIEG